MNSEFHQVLLLDQLYLDSTTIIHRMNSPTRYSAGAAMTCTDLETIICIIELIQFLQLWPPSFIRTDGAFQNKIDQRFLNHYDILLRSVTPRHHS